MSQLLLVSTLLAGLAMGGAFAMLATQERERLRAIVVYLFMASGIAFVFGTTLDALILPGMKHAQKFGSEA